MLYVLAIFLPPVALLVCNKPGQAVLNFFLCFLLWFPAVIHAIIIVAEHNANLRTDRIVSAIRGPSSPPAPRRRSPAASQAKPIDFNFTE